MKSYFVADAGQQRGPFPLDQLSTQGVRPDVMIWAEGMPHWMPARDVPEVAAMIGGGAVPPQAGYASPSPAPPAAGYPPGVGYPMTGAPMYPQGMSGPYPVPADASSKKIGAGLCALLIGSLGIHKFVLGYTTAGIIYLLVSVVGGIVTCGAATAVMHVIALVEGIIYLTKSDAEFYETYVVRKKEWF